jgi:hypothetical protein
VKLLRVLENREIKRVGAPTSLTIDIRVLAATNRPSPTWSPTARSGRTSTTGSTSGRSGFPPLRERPDDVEALVRHFIEQHNRRLGCAVTSISPRTLQLLQAYPWPGNVRELANVVERSMVVAHGVRPPPRAPAVRSVRPRGVAPSRARPDPPISRSRPLSATRSYGRCRPPAASASKPRACSGCPVARCTASSIATASRDVALPSTPSVGRPRGPGGSHDELDRRQSPHPHRGRPSAHRGAGRDPAAVSKGCNLIAVPAAGRPSRCSIGSRSTWSCSTS